MGDGHVVFITENIPSKAMAKKITRSGQEVIQD
jgi:hypothetical protein